MQFCGKRKHYKDECYHKQRLSAKFKTENTSGKGSDKGTADKESGKGKSKGNGIPKVAKTKVNQEALTASQTRTRTRISPEGTAILHQGENLGPLVGNSTRDPRPVPRRKPHKNKGLDVPTKMGISQTPANVPVSCAWRGNCERRGLK